jgi:lipopolysaccharide exporter
MISKLRNSAFAKDTAVLGLGTIGAQVVAIAAMPVLSRLYSPVEFGLLAIFIAVSSIVATAVTLRFETAVLLPKGDTESDYIVMLSLTLAVLLAGSLSLFTVLISEKVLSVIGVRELGRWFPVAVLAGLGGAVVATGSAWFNRRRAYGDLARLRVVQSASAVIIGIVLGYSGAGYGLIIAQVVALVIVCALIAMQVLPRMQRWSYRSMLAVATAHRAAPRFLLPTALLDVVSIQLPLFLISAWFSNEASGQFSMAWRTVALPITLIGSAIGQVFFQRFAQAWPDVVSSRRLLFSTWKTLGLLGLLPVVLLVAYGEPLFIFILGEAWGEAGVIAGVIAPMLFVMFISSTTSAAFIVLGLQKHTLIFGFMFIIYRGGCILLGATFGDLNMGLLLWVIIEIAAICMYNLILLSRIRHNEIN